MARPRSKVAQSKMLDAAREIVLADGVSNCTIDQIARRSGVAKTTIYRHYGGLVELIFASVASDVSNTEAPDTGSLGGDLRQIQRHYVEVARHPIVRELFVWMVSQAMADPTYAAMFRKVRVQPQGPTAIALQRAIARAELPPTVDIDMAIHLIQGPFISKRIVDDSDIDPEDIDAMVDASLRALKVETEPSP